MQIEQTYIKDLVVCTPRIFPDERGYFFESFNAKTCADYFSPNFVQDNQSASTFGVLRGLHMQTGEMAQAKLVRVISGAVLDVAVDLRSDSSTYGKHFSIELSGENNKQLYVPRGFAHGFVVLSETAIFSYKCDNFYSKEHEAGLRYDDPSLAIDWRLPSEQLIVSEKDEVLPFLDQLTND